MPRKPRSNWGHRTRNALRVRNQRINETEQEHDERICRVRDQWDRSRSEMRSNNVNAINLNKIAFEYDYGLDYGSHKHVVIGAMDNVCIYCRALKFKIETPGMCCAGGKVQLPELEYPPEPLKSLLSGTSPDSKHFLEKISVYNASFQMTSFGATRIISDNYMPTFKIQGQAYHLIGSLLPLPNDDYKCLQNYFINNNDEECDRCCSFVQNIKRIIMRELQDLLHQHNVLIRSFKTAIDRLPTDNYKIKIKANKTPVGQHSGRFNQPTSPDDVAIVICGEGFQPRDIVLQKRNNLVSRVSETHCKYDALQYPILFCRREDVYSIDIKQRNPTNGQELNKTVSAMKNYSYRIMLRRNQENYILKCRKLFHQRQND